MKELFFWRVWSPAERRMTLFLFGLILVSLAGAVFFSGLLYPGQRVAWDLVTQLQERLVPANRIDFEGLRFEVPVPSAYVTGQFAAPLMMPDVITSLTFMLLALAGLSTVLAGLTTLSRFWFLGGMGIFILLFVFSRTEMIAFAGLPERIVLVSALLCFNGVAYYFHAFRPHTALVTRIFAFAGLSALLLAAVSFSATAAPLYTFLVYSLPLWLVPTLVFLVVCATEIIYGLVWVATSRATGMGKKSLVNLAVMLLIYLLVLVFAYVGNTRMATWGIVLVPVYFLAAAAALIGLFGFRLRCESTEGQLPFRSSGFWIYSGLMLISIGMTGIAVIAANDPLLELLEDTVVNAQLGMGVVFVFYIVANFVPLFRNGLQVHKVLYKPQNFSLTKARIIGFGVVIGLFSMQNLFPVKQGIAGYFNGLGDRHLLTEEYVLAEQYYRMSLQQALQNHKGNYALASLARIQGDNSAAVFYYRQATLKKPSPQAYVGLGNLLAHDNLYFEAMFSLKEGARAFPGNGQILNNLGMLYAKTNLADSAYYFLHLAEKEAGDVPAANILGVLSGVLEPAELDSVSYAMKTGNDLVWAANRLLVSNLAGKRTPLEARRDAIRKDSLLNAAGYAYWLNYAYNQAGNDSLLAAKLKRIVGKNNAMSDDLLLATAHADFYGGDKTNAIETVLTLAEGEGEQVSLYRKVLGHWFLQLGLYDAAIGFFSRVSEPEGVIGEAIAQSLTGNQSVAAIILERLKASGYDSARVAAFQDRVVSLKKLPSKSDSLLVLARSSATEGAYRALLRHNPFDSRAVAETVAFLTRQKPSRTEAAYQVVVNALRFNDKSPVLWEQYVLLNLELGLLNEAEEGMENVRKYAAEADYHRFFTHYQQIRSLKQKERAEFQ